MGQVFLLLAFSLAYSQQQLGKSCRSSYSFTTNPLTGELDCLAQLESFQVYESTPDQFVSIISRDAVGKIPLGSVLNKVWSSNTAPTFLLGRASGTHSVPLALKAATVIGGVGARGYDGTDFSATANAGIGFYADEDLTPTRHGGRISFYTMPVGTIKPTVERLRIDSAGLVKVQQNLEVVGTAKVTTLTVSGLGSLVGRTLCVLDETGRIGTQAVLPPGAPCL